MTEDCLQPFMRGRLKKCSKEILEKTFPDLGYEILVLETSDAIQYHENLLQLSHENLLRSVAVFDVPNTKFSVVYFEDCFSSISKLSSLLFGDGPKSVPCDMSPVFQKLIFQIAKTLHLLHTRKQYHGYLKNESTFLSDLGGTCNVKLASIRGLLNTGESNEKVYDEDWHALGIMIDDIFKKNDRTPAYSVQSYIDHLQGANPRRFVFNHPIWLSTSHKISLILEMEEAQNSVNVSSLKKSYWPKDDRLLEILKTESQRNYTCDVLGFVRLLKNKYCHPRFENTSFEEFNGNFILFLEEIEKRNPEFWTELLREIQIDLKLEVPEVTNGYTAWYHSIDLEVPEVTNGYTAWYHSIDLVGHGVPMHLLVPMGGEERTGFSGFIQGHRSVEGHCCFHLRERVQCLGEKDRAAVVAPLQNFL